MHEQPEYLQQTHLSKLTKLERSSLNVCTHEIELGDTEATRTEVDASRPSKRLYKLVTDR